MRETQARKESRARGRARVWGCAPAGIATCLLALVAVPAAGAQESGPPSSAPAVSATVEQCLTASTADGRAVTFTAQMETIAAAHRMAMQILVQERAPGDSDFHTLAATGPATWERSEAGVKIYKYVRQVTDLPAPAAFRALVRYRWLDETGRVIRTEKRHTSVCREDRSRASAGPTGSGPGGTGSGTPGAGGTSGGAGGGGGTGSGASGTGTSGGGTSGNGASGGSASGGENAGLSASVASASATTSARPRSAFAA